jgi:hypothetical protein
MNHFMIIRFALSVLLLPLLTASAIAQDTPLDEEPVEIRRYTVELIIFSYAQSVSAGTEIFVADEPPPVDPLLEDALLDGAPIDEVIESIEPEAADLLDEDAIENEILMLPEEDFTLLEAMDHLDRLDAYTPLMHFGWTQATYPEEETEARPLSFYMAPPVGLEGELTLYLSRYLHLDVNLQLDAPLDSNAEIRQSTQRSDRRFDSFADEIVVSYPVRYRIEEDRIFRNGDLRYYDHPKFGVLAKITRVEEEEPTDDELFGEAELLGFDGE